jgi:enamine deaminase RidA (YjgF/YER057c/UK114 family)
MAAESRLKEKNITLPTPNTPVANYVGAVRAGNLLFVSGHGPLRNDGKPAVRGKVGRELSVEQGYQVAREVGLNLLATTRASLGSLDKVKRVVKVLGMVNSADGFGDQPKVINGFSDLMVEVFGEAIGKHARSAVGMAELPMGIPVEIEMVLEVE